MKKTLSILLVFVMIIGMLPTSIFATDTKGVNVGFAVVDCVNGNVEVMRKELTVEPGLALEYLDGQYGDSIGLTVEIGENDVTPIDVLVAAHLAEYGENFTDSTAEDYITGFDYCSKMFGVNSEVTYTVNGIMPYMPMSDPNNTSGYDIGYAINQYIAQPDDEICFYRIDYSAYPPSVFASFEETEYEVYTGEELSINLGFCATMSYSEELIAASNTEIYILNEDGSVGEKTSYITDENGNVNISFETAGTYYLTCKGEISYYDAMWGMESTGVLSPAYTKITVKEKQTNTPPALREGVSAENIVRIELGESYELRLAEDRVFTDADGDALTYQVKIGEANTVNADASYSFTPSEVGEYVLVFTASDGKDMSADTYTVILNVTNSIATFNTTILIPEDITPEFYITNGYENKVDALGDALESEKGEILNGFTTYTLKVPENVNTVSVRAKKGNILLGGMSIPVSENSCVSFKEVRVFIPTKINGNYITSQQAAIEVKDSYGNYATAGINDTDNEEILYYTFFLAATGNESLYTFYAKPVGEAADVFETTISYNKAIVATDSAIYETSVELSYKNVFKLNAPHDAKVKLFYQNKYFNTSEIAPFDIISEQDGTKTYYFNTSSANSRYSYRVSKAGKITKGGYISDNEQKVSWSDDDFAPDAKISYDKSSKFGSRGDDSLLLNVNSQQRLVLSKDESFKLRAYRIWQIINNDTENIMIEPDFTYNILSGSDVINISSVTSGNGNAKNNWLNIKAVGEGTAILEIGYDALNIISGNGGVNALNDFTFSSCDDARKGLVVVQTANAATDVEFGIKSREKWDVEFDTLYFSGEYTTIDFAPTVTEGAISKVEFSNDKGESWNEIKKKDDFYTARIISGNNLLKVTKDDGTTSYQVVRGDKIYVSVTNITNPGANLSAGNTARLTLDGVHFPMGKMSGIYNPGYGYGHKVTYKMGENHVQTDGVFQYDFPKNAYVEITIPDNATPGDTINLTDGYIYFNSMGSIAGEHRNITDDGVSADFNALSTNYSRSVLPDITITLETGNPGGDSGYDDDLSNPEEPTKPEESIDTSDLKFDISGSEIKGYVTISFTDNGKRKSGETGVVYKNALGKIIGEVKVPFKSRDTVASVTLRLLKALGIKAIYTGMATSNFYLSSIGNFTLNGEYYPSFGEFDAGAASGWMVKHNNWFINMGASEFAVEDGDTVQWLYTCQRGADIGCDWSNPSAEITGIKWGANYGTLSPTFSKDITQYSYTVSSSTSSVSLQAEQENYWAKVTYKSEGKTYNAMEPIPVTDGTVITIESSFAEHMGHTPTDTDSIKITIKKSSGGLISGLGSSTKDDDEIKTEDTPQNETNEKPTFTETTFTDVKKNDWHYESVKYVYENNLMQGTGNGFEPESKMSRAMLVTVLYRMANSKNSETTHNFADVPEGQWYSDAVKWAALNGIVSGINATEFAPNIDISREQMALIIYRFAKMQGYDVSSEADISTFTDTNLVSDWALDALCWANKTELIKGTSETTLSPKATATRAQVAAILMRFCKIKPR